MPLSTRDQGLMVGFPPPPEKRVTRQNWRLPPYNRWFLKNARALIPTLGVGRPPQASLLSRAPEALDPLPFQGPDGAETTLRHFLAEHCFDGFLVLHRGRVVYERYLDGMREDQPHYAMSITKSVVGALAGILWGRGLIDLQAPVTYYVPELAKGGYRDALLWQVLDMRSGISFIEDYEDPRGDFRRVLAAVGWTPEEPGDPGCLFELIAGQPLAGTHGGDFLYRSIETDVVAWILSRVSGLNLAELLAELLWRPMGAEFDAYFSVDRAGLPIAHGGLNLTLRDLGRFGQLMLDEGFHNGRQILPAEWAQACRRGDGDAFRANGGLAELGYPDSAYSRKWWVLDKARGLHAGLGIFGQLLWVEPQRQLVAAALASWPSARNVDTRAASYRACEAVGRALAG